MFLSNLYYKALTHKSIIISVSVSDLNTELNKTNFFWLFCVCLINELNETKHIEIIIIIVESLSCFDDYYLLFPARELVKRCDIIKMKRKRNKTIHKQKNVIRILFNCCGSGVYNLIPFTEHFNHEHFIYIFFFHFCHSSFG